MWFSGWHTLSAQAHAWRPVGVPQDIEYSQTILGVPILSFSLQSAHYPDELSIQSCSMQGYQQLARRLTKQTDPVPRSRTPIDHGVFNFLVLVVHRWHMVSRSPSLPLTSLTPGSTPANRTCSPTSPQPESARVGGTSDTTQLAADKASVMTLSKRVSEEMQAIQTLLTEFFSRCREVCSTLNVCNLHACLMSRRTHACRSVRR